MTRFEKLSELATSAFEMSRKTTDENLKTFYENASEGFLIKMGKLTIQEAENEN